MSWLFFYEIEMVPVAVHLFVLIWTHLFPVKKIQNPAKSLMAGCCYYSDLAAENAASWAVAQTAYRKWNRRLFVPNILCSLLAVTVYVFLLKPVELDLQAVLMMLLCLLVPIAVMTAVRIKTERELRQSIGGGQKENEYS